MTMFNLSFSSFRPADAVVFHRLGLFVAQVTESTNKKADERIARARRAIDELRQIVPYLTDMMSGVGPVNTLRGSKAAKELRSYRELLPATERFGQLFPKFLDEHRALAEPELSETIERFVAWLPERVAELRKHVREFEEKVATDLKADEAQLRQVEEVWSPAVGDGLQ